MIGHDDPLIGHDDPRPVRLPLNALGDTPDRSQTSHTGLGEAGTCGRVVPEMDIDIVAPAVRRRDFGDGAIDSSGPRLDVDDGALQGRFSRLDLADIDVAAAAADTIDDQLLAVIALVGEPALPFCR
jgi:hypothetical protein